METRLCWPLPPSTERFGYLFFNTMGKTEIKTEMVRALTTKEKKKMAWHAL